MSFVQDSKGTTQHKRGKIQLLAWLAGALGAIFLSFPLAPAYSQTPSQSAQTSQQACAIKPDCSRSCLENNAQRPQTARSQQAS